MLEKMASLCREKAMLWKGTTLPMIDKPFKEGAEALGLTLEEALKHLGQTTFDIYLNEVAYWRNIPDKVWNYYIGGYQVIKKWLSYREQPLLGRPLTIEEAGK